MNKRASWTLLQTMTIIVGVLVAFILITIVHRTTSQEGAESFFLATDSAMLTDAILSTPMDVQVVYPPKEFTKWYVKLSNSSVSVFHSLPEPNKTSIYNYYFVPRSDIKIQEKDLRLSVLYFIKEGDNFTISNIPKAGEEKPYD